jgi:hypothetical protein
VFVVMLLIGAPSVVCCGQLSSIGLANAANGINANRYKNFFIVTPN